MEQIVSNSVAFKFIRFKLLPLGCGRSGDWQLESSLKNQQELSDASFMDQNLKGMFTTSCGIHAMKN